MGKLTFTCDSNSKSNADFFITYDRNNWNWNDFGYYIRYKLYATPNITPNGKEVFVGYIGILDKNQEMAKHNWLEDTLREKDEFQLFYELPETFSSDITVTAATMLWMLLDKKQREEFVKAMHLILDSEGPYWENIVGKAGPLFRNGIDWAKKNYLGQVKEIILCPTDFRMTMECYHQLFD